MKTFLENYQYVMEYDTEAYIDPNIIQSVLKLAVSTTPSKQNMMPYKVHVIGPENSKIKELIAIKSKQHQDDFTNEPRAKNLRSSTYQINNIRTAPYVLMFTQRIETDPSQIYKDLMTRGFYFEQTDSNDPTESKNVSMLETGMFAYAISNLFLQHQINISYTMSFYTDQKTWSEPEFGFLDMPVWLVMTVGKGKVFRRQHYPHLTLDIDHKPEYNKVINFV